MIGLSPTVTLAPIPKCWPQLVGKSHFTVFCFVLFSVNGVLGGKSTFVLEGHCLASLVAGLVKNPPALRETWVQSLGWKDPLEKRKTTHSSIVALRIPWTV